MKEKKNIVILRTNDMMQTKIAKTITSDFREFYPDYEVITVDEQSYRNFAVNSRKFFKGLVTTFVPFVYRAFVFARNKRAIKKAKINSSIYSSTKSVKGIKEGAKCFLKPFKNIVDRFNPQCVISLDTKLLSKLVSAKKKYHLDTKIVSVLDDSYFNVRNMFFGVDKFIVQNSNCQNTILSYGIEQTKVEVARVCEYSIDNLKKSEYKANLGLDENPTFFIAPTSLQKSKFKTMINQLYQINPEFNIFLYCDTNAKLVKYFSKFKDVNSYKKIKFIADFNKYIAGSDYVLSSMDLIVIYQALSKSVLPFVYVNSVVDKEDLKYYVDKELVVPIYDIKNLKREFDAVFTDAKKEMIMKDKAKINLTEMAEDSVSNSIHKLIMN